MGNTEADIFDDNILGKRQYNSAGCWWLTPATRPSTLRQRGLVGGVGYNNFILKQIL